MSRKSARLLGQQLGMNAHEVNNALDELGYIKQSNCVTLQGSPTWDITEKGRQHGEPSRNPHSSGYIWDDDVVDEIKKMKK